MANIIDDRSTDSDEPSVNEVPSISDRNGLNGSTKVDVTEIDDYDQSSSRVEENQDDAESLIHRPSNGSSLLQAFTATSHLLTTIEARKR